MNANAIDRNLQPSPARWRFPRHATAWIATLTLLLFGFLLPARAQDLQLNPNYPINTNASLGGSVSFRVTVSSTNYPLTFQWQHEGTNLPGATNYLLVLTNLSVADAGGYRALIWNASNESTNTRTAILTVDRTFTKITTGPLVTDTAGGWNASWVDYDGDGKLDVSVAPSGNVVEATRMYHNEGGGTFRRVTTNTIAKTAVQSWAHVWADYDNDGKVDLFVPNIGGVNDMLFHNDGNGSFTRITKGHPVINTINSNAGVWADYDRDGFLDLFVTDDCPSLYRSNGDGTFRKMTLAEAGTISSCLLSDYAVWADVDNDGWPELYRNAVGDVSIQNWSMTNHVYHLDSEGKFYSMDIGEMKKGKEGYTGIIWVDYDNDGLQDAVVGAERGLLGLYRNLGEQGFTNVTASAFPSPLTNSFSGQTVDYDNDGWQDLVVVPWVTSPPALYRNNRDGTFTRISIGSPTSLPGSLYWGDYDNDGFQDILALRGPGIRNSLYRHNGNTNHWLKVKLDGRASNRSGIGAKVRVNATIGGRTFWQLREISGQGIGLDNGLIAHLGLGDATNVDLIQIEWPSGNVQEIANAAPDQTRTVTEAVNITPVRPTASLNGSVMLARSAVAGASYQWQFNGLDLAGQTNRTLNLTNIVADQQGRYSVVVSNASMLATNCVYLQVDTTFSKITEGPVATDLGVSPLAPAWGDLNNDGYVDLLIVDEGRWGSASDYQQALQMVYLNNRDGTFHRAAEAEIGPLASTALFATPISLTDYDNDGYLDVYMYEGLDRNPEKVAYLYRGGPDGRFTLVDQDAGINRPLSPWLPGGYYVGPWGVSWVDYNQDGFLDIYLTTAWTSSSTVDQLWRNNGNGTFSRVLTNVFKSVFDSNFASWADYDNDGDPDLFVGGLNNTGRFYRNDENGQFTDLSTSLGLTWSWYGAWGDYDNDGRLDLHTSKGLFWNDGTGHFLGKTGSAYPGEGAATWIDYDNDGYLDYFSPYYATSQRCLMRNNRDGTFTKVSLGNLTEDPATGGMAVWADYDNNGFLDVVFANRASNKVNNLYHNSGNGNHWLLVKLVGTTSNRSAIGAKVRAQATIWGKGVQQMREISGTPFAGDLRAHFGLGNTTNITTLRIEWPSGTVQELKNVPADQMLTIIEPRRPVLAVTVTPALVTGTLTGDTNQVYQVHMSDDMATGWTVLTTVTTDTSGKGNWSDPGAAPQGRRFYKAVKTP